MTEIVEGARGVPLGSRVAPAAFRLAARRLLNRFGLVAALASVVAVVCLAGAAHASSPASAADDALVDVCGVVLPLLAYALVARASAFGNVVNSVGSLARHGGNRRTCVATVLLGASAACAVLGAVLASLAVLIARGASDPRLVTDAFTSLWIGALSGAVYALCLGAGGTFGREGLGRFVVLSFDWLLGSSTDFASALTPRGHTLNLLGAAPVLEMPQSQAAAALVLIGGAAGAVALLRTPR